MKKPDYLLFDKNTTAIIYGNQQKVVQRMLEFDYLSKRKVPSVAAVINPTGGELEYMKVFFGKEEILIPVYNNLKIAARKHPKADVVINFASFRSAYDVTMQALSIPTIRTVVVIAEGIPERFARKMNVHAKELGKWIIGPATVGGIMPGAFKIGNAGGALSNLQMSKLYQPGSVGLVSKSGGMLNEMTNIISRNTDGLYEGIAIGGDTYPGSSLLDHLLRYEKNPEISMLVVLGELGGKEEYKIIDALKKGLITKPLVAWVTGTCAKIFPGEVQFGHAGAMAHSDDESADAKNRALKKAGAYVPESFDEIDSLIKEVYEELRSKGKLEEKEKVNPPEIPMEFDIRKVRRPTTIITTISDDRGEEPLYAGIKISEIIEKNYSIGDVVSLLWFKKLLPTYVSEFIELVLKVAADHGPCVSGAHNAIVTARAGKDLPTAVASGILTIGPMFGGAIDGAARYFKSAYDRGLTPKEFVEEMKSKGIKIPGIGHRIKSTLNPDKRVEILKKWADNKLPSHKLLDYALKVEKITTAKKNNLILNVDGCIGVLFIDILRATNSFKEEEIDEIIEIGTLNGLFVLARTIGIIGHYLDQKRLHSKLYRHPWDDVLYLLPKKKDVIKYRENGSKKKTKRS